MVNVTKIGVYRAFYFAFFIICFSPCLGALKELPPLHTFVCQLLDEYKIAYPAYYNSLSFSTVSRTSNFCAQENIGLSFIDTLYDFLRDEGARISVTEDWIPWVGQCNGENFFRSIKVDSVKDIALENNFFWVQKKVIAAGDRVHFIGDLHGDMCSLLLILLDLQRQGVLDERYVVNDGEHIIFTGDYIDRGPYSLDVFAFALYLKLKNPERVVLLRGNHEEYVRGIFGSQIPGIARMVSPDDVRGRATFMRDLNKVFNLLPSALYLGVESVSAHCTDYILVSHGGLELLYYPSELLASGCQYAFICWSYKAGNQGRQNRLRARIAKDMLGEFVGETCFNDAALGFLWGDFLSENYERDLFGVPGARLPLGKKVVDAIFEKSVEGVPAVIHMLVRGHQHQLGCFAISPDACVYTVIPCDYMIRHLVDTTILGCQTIFKTLYVSLKTAEKKADWHLYSNDITGEVNKREITTKVSQERLPRSLDPEGKSDCSAHFIVTWLVGEPLVYNAKDDVLLCDESPLDSCE